MSNAIPVSKWHAWMLAIRPRTLPAAVAPVLVGTALAWSDGAFSLWRALAAALVSLLLQIGANLANDYFDYVNGVDGVERKGPQRAAQSGWIPLGQLRFGIRLTLAAATLVGAFLAIVGGWPVLALGVAAVLSSIAYTGGPLPVGYHGLGDLFVFVFFGLGAVCGTYYVQTLGLSPAVLAAACAVGALTAAILVVNNLRDTDTDALTGKRTLAVMLGPRATRVEYVLLVMAAYAIPPVLWLVGWLPAWVLLSWLTMPLAARLIRNIHSASVGPAFNQILAQTASLDLAFSALFAVGTML